MRQDPSDIDQTEGRVVLAGVAEPDEPQPASAARQFPSQGWPPGQLDSVEGIIDDSGRPIDQLRQSRRGDGDGINLVDHAPQAIGAVAVIVPSFRIVKVIVAEIEYCPGSQSTQVGGDIEVFVAVRFLKNDGPVAVHLRAVEEFAGPAGGAQIFERPVTAKPGAREFRRRRRGFPGYDRWIHRNRLTLRRSHETGPNGQRARLRERMRTTAAPARGGA